MAGPDRILALKLVTDVGEAEKGIKKVGKTIAAVFAVDKVLDFGKAAVTMADDVDQGEGKLDQLLGTHSKVVKQFAKGTKVLGISRRDAIKYTGSIAALTRVQGANKKESAEMSTRWTTLGADMAAFNNANPTDVLNAMTSALTGEFEPLKKYGVLLNANKVNQYAWTHGIAENGKALTDRQKLLAIDGLMMEQTKDQQGQLARESDTLGAKQNRLNATFADFQLMIGEMLLPIISNFASFLTDTLVPAIGDLSSWITDMTGIGPDAQVAILGIAGAVAILAAVSMGHPIIAFVAAMAALVAITAIAVREDWLGKLATSADDAREKLRDGVDPGPWERGLLALDSARKTFLDPMKDIFDDIATVWTTAQELISGDTSGWLDGLLALIRGGMATLLLPVKWAWGIIKGIFDQVGIDIEGIVKDVFDTIVGTVRNALNTIIRWWNTLEFSIPPFEVFIPQQGFDSPLGFVGWRDTTLGFKGTGDLIPELDLIGGRMGDKGHHKAGLWDVPFDDYPALLHRGEMVVPSDFAQNLRGGGMGGGITVNVMVGPTSDPARVGEEVVRAIEAYERRSGKGWRH